MQTTTVAKGLTLLTLAFGLASCAITPTSAPLPPAQSVVLPKSAPSKQAALVSPGDQLELVVMEDKKFNGLYTVRESGAVIIPNLGRAHLGGKKLSEAELLITELLENDQLNKASVILERVSSVATPAQIEKTPSVNVFLSGSVRKPGQHQIRIPKNRKLGIYDAIMIGGGISKFGDQRKVEIIRTGPDNRRVTHLVNLRRIGSGQEPDIPVAEGDIINVKEMVFGI